MKVATRNHVFVRLVALTLLVWSMGLVGRATASARPDLRLTPSQVTGLSSHLVDRSTLIETNTESFEATPDHLFYVGGRAWVAAAELRLGDRLDASATTGEAPVTVRAVVTGASPPRTVYNLLVARHHTFRIGTAGVLVHNGGCFSEPSPALTSLAERARVDLSNFDGPSKNPEAAARLIKAMRADLDPATRARVQREIDGRRYLGQQRYEKAVSAGFRNPELSRGEPNYRAWLSASNRMLRAAREDEPLTVSLLKEAHALASKDILPERERGLLRSQKDEVMYQAGPKGIGIHDVTPEEFDVLRKNPDLETPEVGKNANGTHRVFLYHLDPEQVNRRTEEAIAKINARLERGDDPVKVAADGQRELVSIHPFRDGNGRTTRLAMDYLLVRKRFGPSLVAEPDRNVQLSVTQWRDEVRAGFAKPFEIVFDAWKKSQAAATPSKAAHGSANYPTRGGG